MKNRFIRKISLIFIIMLFLIGMSYTIVNATTYKTTGQTTVYYRDETTNRLSGSNASIAGDQEIEAGTYTATINVNNRAVFCRRIDSDSLTLTTGRTISKMDGMEWFIPVGALEEVSAEDSSETDSGEPLVNGGDKVLITTNPNMENATNLTDMSITSNLDKYENNGVEGADVLRDKSNIIVGVLQAVGTVVAVIMLTIIAIKYMISSIEERAEYKQTMVPYIIGAASILIISNLVGLIYSIITNLNI